MQDIKLQAKQYFPIRLLHKAYKTEILNLQKKFGTFLRDFNKNSTQQQFVKMAGSVLN